MATETERITARSLGGGGGETGLQEPPTASRAIIQPHSCPSSPGSTLGPYAIRAELGHGGIGVVYTAYDPRLARQVAIKVLLPDLIRES